jgi:hypothetical protein
MAAFVVATGGGMVERHVLIPAAPTRRSSYKGFAITARTFQLRGSDRWTLDLLIGRSGGLRAFSRPVTYATEAAAILGCFRFAERIIDGQVRECSVDDLT